MPTQHCEKKVEKGDSVVDLPEKEGWEKKTLQSNQLTLNEILWSSKASRFSHFKEKSSRSFITLSSLYHTIHLPLPRVCGKTLSAKRWKAIRFMRRENGCSEEKEDCQGSMLVFAKYVFGMQIGNCEKNHIPLLYDEPRQSISLNAVLMERKFIFFS